MEKKELISRDEYCIIEITKYGKEYLRVNNLLDIDIYNLYDENQTKRNFKLHSINTNEIYIPKNFQYYFKGYKK